VGSPQTIAGRLKDILGGGELDGLMLIFPDYIEGVPLFAEQVMPAIRARFPCETKEVKAS
jgi:pyrimidine oxygenase